MDVLEQESKKASDMSTKTNYQWWMFLSEVLCRVAELPKNFLADNKEVFWFHYHLLTGGSISADGPFQPSDSGLVQDKYAGIIIAAHMSCLEKEIELDQPGYYVVFQEEEPAEMTTAVESNPVGEPVGDPVGMQPDGLAS